MSDALQMIKELKRENLELQKDLRIERRLREEAESTAPPVVTEEVACFLSQIIEMNGEDYFWAHLAKMPITKFNGPLRAALQAQREDVRRQQQAIEGQR